MKNKYPLIIAMAFMLQVSGQVEAKLYKWVDEKGVTHYGEVIPPEYANRDTQQLNKGRVTDRNDKFSTAKEAEKTDPKQIEEKRRDDALLKTYTNESEIDLSRDRSLVQVEARVNSYTTMLQGAKNSLAELQKESETIVKQGRNIPASLSDDIKGAEARVSRVQKQLEDSQKEMVAVKEKFEADKLRFRKLKGTSN